MAKEQLVGSYLVRFTEGDGRHARARLQDLRSGEVLEFETWVAAWSFVDEAVRAQRPTTTVADTGRAPPSGREEETMHHHRIRRAALALAALLLAGAPALAQECTKYVSEAGSGRVASLERPARDLGNIVGDLEPGDVVCITGGTFTGRADSGADRIEVPVEIYGGFAPDFSSRDPWGAHAPCSPASTTPQNFVTDTRLTIDTSGFATRLMAARGEPTEHTRGRRRHGHRPRRPQLLRRRRRSSASSARARRSTRRPPRAAGS
jgi:hypothetical protein